MNEKLNMNCLIEEIIKYMKVNQLGEYYTDCSFKMLTTLKVGGLIKLLYIPKDIESLIIAYEYITKLKVPLFVIGNGSNVLASDKMYEGVVVSLKERFKEINYIEIDKEKSLISVESGCSTKRFTEFLRQKGLTGAEAIASIPATIGGILTMNATCYGFNCEKFFKRALVLINGKLEWLSLKDLEFAYRSSKILKCKGIILKIEFVFPKGDIEKIKENEYLINEKKKKSQPINSKSAGSTFKNGKDYLAWEVIDKAGLRGYTIGEAKVSDVHSNFIINVGKASANDVYLLMRFIQKTVYEKLNIELENEWILVNF